MQDFIRAIKALSDETRIRILKLLLERDCCVCEVMQALNISQSRASRNLGILENTGFATSRRDGLWVTHSINSLSINRHATLLTELLKNSLVDNETLAQDRERLKHAVRSGTGCATG